MRIALIGRRFDPTGGGTERDLIVTAEILARAGHEVRVYSNEVRAPSPRWDVRRLGGPPLGRALGLWWFANAAGRAARRDGADLVLSFARIIDADILRAGGAAHSSYLRAARQWQNGAATAAMRLSPYHRVQTAIERYGYSCPRLKKAIAVSNLVRGDLVATFAIDPAVAVTLYNGVDLERFRPAADLALRPQVRSELGIPDSAAAVAFVGNGFARKGLRFLIEAWPTLGPAAYLVVAGTDRSALRYQRLAYRLGVGDRVRFIGVHQRVERLFAAMDALALPSQFEPFGNVLMEAIAAGLPVLASAACGAVETLPSELREFVVADPADIDELGTRMKALIAASGGLGAIARAVAERFTWERYGTGLLGLIAGL
jgi:UDP-glucose:(heptosyl)LPS alpha-1,3-glucosyltransferase